MFALIEAVVVLCLVAGLVLVVYTTLTGRGRQAGDGRAPVRRWEASHYAANGVTKVVVSRTAPGGGRAGDEHVVAIIRDDDPDFDARFLEAMARARSRAALFDSEA